MSNIVDEHVILLDRRGRADGTAPKRSVHHADTPLHLGFSCYLLDDEGRVLLTRRAVSKLTWPGAWTNACCGHPSAGETLREAVRRRLLHELGVGAGAMTLALADFTYRAAMADGIVEHEVCPVVVARISGPLVPNPDEVADYEWVRWDDVVERARRRPETLSPWSVDQIVLLEPLAPTLESLLDGAGTNRALDDPVLSAMTVMPVSSHLDPFDPIRRDVDDALEKFIAVQSAELISLDPALASIVGEIDHLVAAGGKRLRPAFVYWGHRAGATTHDPAIVSAAAALEMLHTFALLHDDVMDRSARRRGRPSAHQGLAGTHRDEGLTGDPAWFGVSAAILAGDLAFLWADQLLDEFSGEPTLLERARQVFTTLRREVMAGQYLDVRLDGLAAASENDARRVAVLKSGRYTITRPLELGFALSGADDRRTATALRDYGDALGLAFQLRDDVLGLFGDPTRTGKDTSDDLRSGKRTLLVLRALALGNDAQRNELGRSLGVADLSDDDADRCRDIVARTGALASVEALLNHLRSTAIAALDHVPDPARSALRVLADDVVERDV